MKFPCWPLILYCSLILSCNSADPVFPQEESLISGSMPLGLSIEINPPFLILKKSISETDSLFRKNDSLYVSDARYTESGLGPDMLNYYYDPEMKRTYVNDSHVVLCYGYKKQIDFLDFNFNLINRVKFNFFDSKHIDTEEDINLSYVCSYLGQHYFYTLFWGMAPDDHKTLNSQGTFLEVYDLDGNPVIRYHLKEKPPVYFAVDEDSFTLYGPGRYEHPEKHLLIYKLNGLS